MKAIIFLILMMGAVYCSAVEDAQKAHENVLYFEASLGNDVACRRMMGLDRIDCYSYETCQKACYASTSFCLPIALDMGKEMVFDVWDYQNKSKAVEATILQSESKYQIFEGSPTQANFINYKSSVLLVLEAQQNFAGHKFHGWICEYSAHDEAALTEAMQILGGADISALEGQKIYEENNENTAIKKIDYWNKEAAAQYDEKGLNFQGGLAATAIMLAALAVLAAVVMYLVFVRKPKKGAKS